MERTQVWAMIEGAKRDSAGDAERQTILLEDRIGGLPLEEIIGFQRVLVQLEAESFRVDLWGAAEVISHHCSEDAFFAFRGWLLGQGRQAFEAALADPDSLADFDQLAEGLPGEERCWFIALHAYESRTGEELPDAGWSGEMIGEWWPWERNEIELPRRYPRLWARFKDRRTDA
jgi:hypothetical protein